MGAAIRRTKEATHAPLPKALYGDKDWVVSSKGISPALGRFDDKSMHYRNWRSRVLDRLMGNNLNWGRLLELTEQQRSPLTRERLARMIKVDEASADLNRISNHLWSFLGQHCLANNVYDRRLQLTNGEDCNGLELWRQLDLENQGGAEHVMMAGITRLQRFPRCPHTRAT